MFRKISALLIAFGLTLTGLTPASAATSEPAYNAINLETAWNKGIKGKGVTVAIIDQGLNLRHEYFLGQVVDGVCVYQASSGYLCPNGTRYQTGVEAASQRMINGWLVESEAHGNMVAGIVAGKPNAYAPGGVAPEAKLLMANVDLTLTSIVESLKYVLANVEKHNIVALSMSFGGWGYEMPRSWLVCDENPALAELASLLGQLRAKGVIPFASAGNNPTLDSDLATFPGCLKEAVAIGSVDNKGLIAWYTTMSTKIELLAPDYPISAGTFGYGTSNGTSAAAPMVAGSYALLRQAYPNHNPEHLLDALKASGKKVDDVLRKQIPMVDMAAAITLVDKTPIGTSPLVSTQPVVCKTFTKDLARISTYQGVRWAVYRVNPGCTGNVKVTLNGKSVYSKVIGSTREVKFKLSKNNTIVFYFGTLEQTRAVINL
jgi:subtilisin family serine protease